MGPGSTRLHCQGTTVHLCMYIAYIVLLYICTYTYSSAIIVSDKHCRYVARNFGK